MWGLKKELGSWEYIFGETKRNTIIPRLGCLTKGMRIMLEIFTLLYSSVSGSIMQVAESARESRHWNSYICHDLPLLVCSGFPSLQTAPPSAPGYQLNGKRGQFSLQSSSQNLPESAVSLFSDAWMELKGIIYKIIIIGITVIIT